MTHLEYFETAAFGSMTNVYPTKQCSTHLFGIPNPRGLRIRKGNQSPRIYGSVLDRDFRSSAYLPVSPDREMGDGARQFW